MASFSISERDVRSFTESNAPFPGIDTLRLSKFLLVQLTTARKHRTIIVPARRVLADAHLFQRTAGFRDSRPPLRGVDQIFSVVLARRILRALRLIDFTLT